MIQKYINQLCIYTALIACNGLVEAKLTTLKHFDPSPNYSANNSMMPPNSQFLDLAQARIKKIAPSKSRTIGFNLSGFVQKAVRARGYTGSDEYGSVSGDAPSAFELGDFRGTMYAMGLFLGTNPKTGHNIWASGVDNGDPANVTAASISAFGLPSCLSNIAYQLAGYDPNKTCGPDVAHAVDCSSSSTATPIPVASPNGLVFISNNGAATPLTTGTSIFNANKLAQDTVYFGAFSLPIEYKQTGLRWEVDFNCTDYISLTVQSGVSSMKQHYVNTFRTPSTSGQTAVGPYPLSDLATTSTTPTPVSSLYNQLNISNTTSSGGGTAPNTSPLATAQSAFNKAIGNNIAAILNPNCLDSDPLCGFEEYSIDDVKLILSLKGIYAPFRYRHDDDDDTGSWPDMILTPYAWVGGSFPVGKKVDYNNILSLPFGNNGHASIGGAAGMTFDFAESVEVGFEGGATYFFAHEEIRPFPTHRLQRLLYPFEASVVTQPGINWHFRALLNSYQFLKHCNFWMTYELIEHRKDCFTLSDSTTSKYFVPEVLTCRSDWRAQFFNAGLSFDIQPGLQASLVWQQPISPRNAYYPVSILGSINFMF